MKDRRIVVEPLNIVGKYECEIYDCTNTASDLVFFDIRNLDTEDMDRTIKLCPMCLSKLGIKVIKALR